MTAPETTEHPDLLPVAWTVVHGWVHPYGDAPVNLAALTARLRTHAIAAVSAVAPAPGEAATVGVMVTDEDEPRVAVPTPDGPVPGATLQEMADALALDLDVSISIGTHWSGREEDEDAFGEDAGDVASTEPVDGEAVDGEENEDDEWFVEHPLVIVSRAPESALPLVARDLDAELIAAHDSGWTVATAERDFVFLEHHGWLPSELPAASVGRSGERRYVSVMARTGQPVEFGLVRFDDLIPVLDPTGVPADLVDALTNPHLADGSAVRQLCDSTAFSHLDPYEVSAVLQSTMDDRWTSRVLATLGMPLLAAELAEERATLDESATFVPVRGLGGAFLDCVDRYYRAPAHEVAGRSLIGKAYAAGTATPARVAVTVTAEVLLGIAAARASTTATGWRRRGLRALAASMALDVAGHAVLARRKFRS